MKLRVGDVVVCVDNPNAVFGPAVGEIAEVIAVEGRFVRVDAGRHGAARWARWFPHRFVRVGDVR